MTTKFPTMPLWVCIDCFVLLVNGEVQDGCENPDQLLSELDGLEPTPGMLFRHHEDGCLYHDSPESAPIDDYECACETQSFSWSPCSGCGSNLGGERFAVTAWIDDNSTERICSV